MATYNVGPITANQTVTQNVNPGDTVVVTVQGPGPFDGASSTTQINIGSVTQTGSREYTLSNFTPGTTYTFSTNDDDGDPYTVTGTVSTVVTPPVISGTTFLYYNNQPRALYSTGTTWFVRTRINLSSNGSGGTLEYGRNTSSNSVSGASWQTDGQTYSFPQYDNPVTNDANTWNHALGQTRYFWASQDRATAGSFDSTGGILYPYVNPANVSVDNYTIPFGDSSINVVIQDCDEDSGGALNRVAEVYSISTTDFGSGEIAASTVSADRVAVTDASGGENTSVTISSELPGSAAGSVETYYVYAYRRADWSGKQVYLKRDSFTITRAAPPSTYTVTAPASINEGSTGTINVTTTNVSNGTVLYWSVSTGDTPVDFDSPSSGSVTISNNQASFDVTPTADATTEDAETATVRLRTGSQAGPIVATDTFTINDTSTTPSGSISFTGGSFATEGSGTLGFTFTNTVDGTYYYDVNRLSGSAGSGEIQNPGPTAFTVSGGTGTVNLIIYNDEVSEIGFQGEQFVMRYGTTSNSEDLDTLNFTIYDDDSGISYSDATVDVTSEDTSHTISIVRAAGDSSAAVTARVRNVSTNTVIGSTFSLGTGTTNRSVGDVPSVGNTETFRVEVFNGNTYINGPAYTVTTATAGGGGTTPGSNDYGIEVYGPDGTTPVFTSDYRVANIAVNSSFSLNSGNSYSQTFTCDSAQDTNKIIILFDTGIYIYQQNLVVTRATNQFTLSYPTNTNVSGQVIALRFG